MSDQLENNVMMTFEKFDNVLMHYGVLRKSGRYPWGSGENAYQRHKGFLQYVDELSKKGLSETEIVQGLGLESTTQLRALRSIAKTAKREEDIAMVKRLKAKGMSNVAIGERMGIAESSVRSLLNPMLQDNNMRLANTAEQLKKHLGEDGFLDVGTGTELYLGVSGTMKNTAIAMLEEEGYKKFYVKVEQLGTGQSTNTMVLAPPGTTYPDVMKNTDKIKSVASYSEDNGRSFRQVLPPKSLDSKRIAVRYAEEGGADKDGVIELRRGVDDISLGGNRYAQVRIAVDGTHYLKGMAMYSDNMPDGVDVVFNTNKKRGTDKLKAMKELKKDSDNPEYIDKDMPFGSIVKQRFYKDKNGNEQQSKINIVGDNEEGRWNQWSATLSSQFLSKQTPALAKQQLDLTYQSKRDELDEIMALTNPAVKKKLLQEFADGADASAVHLKAAGLPRTRAQVILPINSLKDNEVYAPNFRDGETVVLIRHPHGGRFEIPELKVNNRNKEALGVIKQAKDAVGINSKVAARLSGADFDGDTVLVIPNNQGKIKTQSPLGKLKDFDPQSAYPGYEGMKPMSAKAKQRQMGDISNLITDMTLRGANNDELARAVRHSMVVIDAEKHKLNYAQSAKDNGIAELKTKYQRGPKSGASTLISLAKSTEYVGQRTPRKAQDGGPIDPITGEKMWTYTGEEYKVQKVSKRTGVVTEKVVRKTQKSTKLGEAKDAHTLSSGTVMESVYADHSNRLKSLANNARKATLAITPIPMSRSAKETYKAQVESLNLKLERAQKNAPLERKAQLLANSIVSAKKQSNPHMEASELKKVKAQALDEARIRTGAKKERIVFTPEEWAAVQAGAISNNKLSAMLDNADMEQVRELATPRTRTVMTDAKIKRAQAMLNVGYSQAEIADALGVPVSTLHDAVK